MALEKLQRGCPYGKDIAKEIENSGGGEGQDLTELEGTVEGIGTELGTVKDRLSAIEGLLATVIAATSEDEDKYLKIDNDGKVVLVNEP